MNTSKLLGGQLRKKQEAEEKTEHVGETIEPRSDARSRKRKVLEAKETGDADDRSKKLREARRRRRQMNKVAFWNVYMVTCTYVCAHG